MIIKPYNSIRSWIHILSCCSPSQKTNANNRNASLAKAAQKERNKSAVRKKWRKKLNYWIVHSLSSGRPFWKKPSKRKHHKPLKERVWICYDTCLFRSFVRSDESMCACANWHNFWGYIMMPLFTYIHNIASTIFCAFKKTQSRYWHENEKTPRNKFIYNMFIEVKK